MARLQFLDVLLGDRPALTPVESFYQRILAGDPDEAHDQAEILLKERPLLSYYDEVALQGLRLAVIDAERGALTPAHLERIKVSVQSLIEDLDDHKDGQSSRDAAEEATTMQPCAEPAAPKHPVADGAAPMLCIAGRGMLDEAVSTMFAQLLEKQGIAARVVEHAAASRAAIGTLDVAGVAMACISCLDLSGSPSHLRYLLRRLRRRLPPNVPVLVGLWPGGEAILTDERVRAAIGADYYTTSLHGAVQACWRSQAGGASTGNHRRTRWRRRCLERAAPLWASPQTNGAKG